LNAELLDFNQGFVHAPPGQEVNKAALQKILTDSLQSKSPTDQAVFVASRISKQQVFFNGNHRTATEALFRILQNAKQATALDPAQVYVDLVQAGGKNQQTAITDATNRLNTVLQVPVNAVSQRAFTDEETANLQGLEKDLPNFYAMARRFTYLGKVAQLKPEEAGSWDRTSLPLRTRFANSWDRFRSSVGVNTLVGVDPQTLLSVKPATTNSAGRPVQLLTIDDLDLDDEDLT
jgi:hypothetical protein